MIALARFRIAAYARSHRAIQPLIGVFAVLAILYASGVPAGSEMTSYADSAAILIPVFAWAARGLLDGEPDEQRMIALTARGRSELLSGLAAAMTFNLVLAAIAVLWPLAAGFAGFPGIGGVLAGIALHGLGVLAGTTIGALTSRPILASPAVSIIVLVGGYIAILLVSTSSGWLTVPVMTWMRAASHGELADRFPAIATATFAWSGVGLLAYAWLRRTRP